jgi:signal peptidase I
VKQIFGHAAILCCAEILLVALLLVAQGAFGWTAAGAGSVFLPVFLILIVGYVLLPRFTPDQYDYGDAPARSDAYRDRISACVLSILLFILFRSLILHPYSVNGGAMRPGLAQATPLIVGKFSYGYSRFSFPFGLISFSGRFPNRIPSRGDIITYRNPKSGNDDVSRVIGLPGDRIQMAKGKVILNGAEIPQTTVRPADVPDRQQYLGASIKRETISGTVAYDILDLVEKGPYDDTREVNVPAGAIFVIGDNRDNSVDSRVFGPVSVDNVIGKVLASL